MRPVSISDGELLTALGEVVSRFGVAGASLNRLSEASGLKRASLYHRFPGGKDEIVEAVVEHTAGRLDDALAPAYEEGDPADRAVRVAAGIDEYYRQGEQSCLIVALSVSEDESRGGAARCLDGWSTAFERLAIDAGRDPAEAGLVAIDAVAAIEGALVVSAATRDTGPFERVLAGLPDRLTSR